MRPLVFGAVCLLMLTMFDRLAAAHPGHEHEGVPSASRTWTLSDTGAHLHGTFVSAKAGQVQVLRDDGRLVTLSVQQLSPADKVWIAGRQAEIRQLNEQVSQEKLLVFAPEAKPAPPPPEIARAFEPFAKLKAITYRWDERYFYVESNGMPDHPMMVGITAWQQQVPLPQKYIGINSWQIPLHPIPAKVPMSAKANFFRGAIALAVNGVPIFNPIKNDGRTDTLLAGELDEYGGHCGRADDYHYHIAPVHLEKQVGKGSVIAFALDGYPIYGYGEADGSQANGLDWLNGHKDAEGHYHYHATKAYPYLNGGFYGEVIEREGQVDPQPRAEPVRPALQPLRGAKIVGFNSPKPNSYSLTYDISGRQGSVNYAIEGNGSVAFQFTDSTGKTTSETYTAARRSPPGGKGGDERRPKGKADDPPPSQDKRPPRRRDNEETSVNAARNNSVLDDSAKTRGNVPQLVVTSSGLDAKGFLSAEFTCDGASASPPVEWNGAPAETQCFALSLWHTAPDQEKSYWVVYDIPANVTKLAKNSKAVGNTGINDKRRAEYDPMCSKGPGVKTYHVTVFALSAAPKLCPDRATRANLLAAIKGITLAEGTLNFQYERKDQK